MENVKTEKILILLSSYNGEKYINEQLDSILHQDGIDYHVLIRDDGSIDSTTDILKKYKEVYSDQIDVEYGQNIGWKKSFFELCKIAESDYGQYEYFAFADQDDIWLPQKLYVAVNALSTVANPVKLYFSNLYYYKDGKSYGKIWHKKPIQSPKRCLLFNYATGCTIVFSKTLLKLIVQKDPSIVAPHDYWAYQTAMLCGETLADENAYIYYRQHDNNQIGSKTGYLDVWKRRIKSLHAILTKHLIEKQAKNLYSTYSKMLTDEGLEAVSTICDYRKNIQTRIKLLLDREYSLNTNSSTYIFKLKGLFGIV